MNKFQYVQKAKTNLYLSVCKPAFGPLKAKACKGTNLASDLLRDRVKWSLVKLHVIEIASLLLRHCELEATWSFKQCTMR